MAWKGLGLGANAAKVVSTVNTEEGRTKAGTGVSVGWHGL